MITHGEEKHSDKKKAQSLIISSMNDYLKKNGIITTLNVIECFDFNLRGLTTVFRSTYFIFGILSILSI